MRLEADLHIHTMASGHAYSSIEEIVRVARQKGLKMIALTDHGPALPGASSLMHFWNLRVLPREMDGIILLKGVEANIIDTKGGIDIPDELIQELDLVLAGFHPYCNYEGGSAEDHTRAMIGAIESGLIDIIAHPANVRYPVDVERVVEAAKIHNVLLEINNNTFLPITARQGSDGLAREIATACFQAGMDVVLSSDAHLAMAVGDFSEALKMAEMVGFQPERIVNSYVDQVFQFLRQRRKELG